MADTLLDRMVRFYLTTGSDEETGQTDIKISIYTTSLIPRKNVIPAKAGIQKGTGFRASS